MAYFTKQNDSYILDEYKEQEILQLQNSIDILEEKLKKIKEQMLLELEQNDEIFENIQQNKVKITYVAPTTRESFDSTKFKKENLDLYNKYIKISEVKSSIRLKVDNK